MGSTNDCFWAKPEAAIFRHELRLSAGTGEGVRYGVQGRARSYCSRGREHADYSVEGVVGERAQDRWHHPSDRGWGAQYGTERKTERARSGEVFARGTAGQDQRTGAGPGLYHSMVANLAAALSVPEAVPRRSTSSVSLSIVSYCGQTTDGGVDAVLYGDLAAIPNMSPGERLTTNDPGHDGPGSLLSVVAGRGFEPLTFRL